MIVGHTDTMGTRQQLGSGMKRARTVRGCSSRRASTPRSIEVTSHGEADLLVKTADNVAEPRNRRVEITVR